MVIKKLLELHKKKDNSAEVRKFIRRDLTNSLEDYLETVLWDQFLYSCFLEEFRNIPISSLPDLSEFELGCLRINRLGNLESRKRIASEASFRGYSIIDSNLLCPGTVVMRGPGFFRIFPGVLESRKFLESARGKGSHSKCFFTLKDYLSLDHLHKFVYSSISSCYLSTFRQESFVEENYFDRYIWRRLG